MGASAFDGEASSLPLGRALHDYLESEGLSELDALAVVISSWESVVGEVAASHSRPRSLHRGELVVAVDHPGWATEMTMLKGTILERFKARFASPIVTALKVRVEARSGLE